MGNEKNRGAPLPFLASRDILPAPSAPPGERPPVPRDSRHTAGPVRSARRPPQRRLSAPPASPAAPPPPPASAAASPSGGRPLERAAPRGAGPRRRATPGAGGVVPWPAPWAQAASCRPRSATLRSPSWLASRPPLMDPFQIPPE